MNTEIMQNATNYTTTLPGYNGYLYFGEGFVKLNWNGIILDRYYISNFGRLYDARDKVFVRYSIDKDGYYMASITVPNVGYKKIRVHRFQHLSFYPEDNYMKLVVNHLDGDKQNNFNMNHEWTSSLKNTRHGWETGLNTNYGTGNGNSKYSDKEIHKICSLIDKGYNNIEIMNAFGITEKPDRMRMSATLTGIRKGKTHLYISKEYNFMKNKEYVKYSEEFTHLICIALSDPNTAHTFESLMELYNIPESQKDCFEIYVRDVVRKRTGKQISDMYPNIKMPQHRETRENVI